eukprot:349858-Chlamydomonas_euryale.AAC.2
MFDSTALRPGAVAIVISKVARRDGQSKQGKARRADVGSIWVDTSTREPPSASACGRQRDIDSTHLTAPQAKSKFGFKV